MSKPNKKGILEKMGLVERVSDGGDYPLPPVDESCYTPESEPLPPPSIYGDEEVTGANYKKSGDNFIISTYESKGLNGKGDRTIFKLEQLRSTLPSTLPKEVQRESVKKMLDAFNLSEYDLISDGQDRIDVLNEGLKEYIHGRAGEIHDMESEIEDAKNLIQRLESRIKETKEETKAVELAVEEQVSRIDELCRFIDSPAREEA